MTIVDVHTGGLWQGSSSELAEHVRPSFQCYIEQCLKHGIPVAVATFSAQYDLLQSVLSARLGTAAADVPVFGGDIELEGYERGKQSQLISAIRFFNDKAGSGQQPFDAATTVLVDDDLRNIKVARKDGYRTIPYIPDADGDGAFLFEAAIQRGG